MAEDLVIPITCTNEEVQAARSAYQRLLTGRRAVKVIIDGETTEFAVVSLSQLGHAIRCMECYLRKQAGVDPVPHVLRVYANSKGF